MTTATDIKTHLGRLVAERLDAVEAGLERNAIYMEELEADLAEARHAYVMAAVTEIASLRAALGDARYG